MRVIAVFGQSQRMLQNVEATKESVVHSFSVEYGIDEEEVNDYLIQRWDTEFDSFLDLIDFSFVENKDKLRFLKPVEENTREERRTVEESSDSDSDGELPLRTRLGGKCVSASFKLPHLELALKQHLEKKEVLPTVWRKKLIKVLFNDMVSKYVTDLYPTRLEYSRVIDALLREYPHHGDRPIPGMRWTNVADPGFTWRDSLRSKFKSERKKLNSEHIKETREKFKRKATPAVMPTLWHNGFLRAGDTAFGVKVSELPQYGEQETATTSKQLGDLINEEWKKPSPDLTLIDKRMGLTKVSRRYQCSQVSVRQIQARFHPLSCSSQWTLEIQRQLGVNMAAKRNDFFTVGRIQRCLEELATKPKGNLMATQIVTAHAENEREGKIVAILTCLPWICNEVLKHWIITYDVVTCSNPMILVHEGTSPSNPFVEAKCVPYLDGVALCTDQLTLLEAIEILAGVMYLMNTKYQPQCYNSWRILCEVIHGLPQTDIVKASLQKLAARIRGPEKE